MRKTLRNILSLTLVILMILSMSLFAFADDEKYGIFISGVEITSANCSNIWDGCAEYVPSTHTLILKKSMTSTIPSENKSISISVASSYKDLLTIYCNTEVTISPTSSITGSDEYWAVYAPDASLKFTGKTLTIKQHSDKSVGIYAKNVTFESPVNIVSASSANNVALKADNIAVTNGGNVSLSGPSGTAFTALAPATDGGTVSLSMSGNSSFKTESTAKATKDKDINLTLNGNFVFRYGTSSSSAQKETDTSKEKTRFKEYGFINIYPDPIVLSVDSPITVGSTSRACATVTPDTATFTWDITTDTPGCASIADEVGSKNKIITGIKPGKVTVKVTKDGTSEFATKEIVIKDKASVTLSKPSIDVDDTVDYEASNIPDGFAVGIKGSNTGCFTYTKTSATEGTITATSPGTVTVFVGPYTGSEVPEPGAMVYDHDTAIAEKSISYDYQFDISFDDPLVYAGETTNARASDSRTVSWYSTDTTVATIDATTGAIQALKPGQTIIRAFTVVPTPAIAYHSDAILVVQENPVDTITIMLESNLITIGEKTTAYAIVAPSTDAYTWTITANPTDCATITNGTGTAEKTITANGKGIVTLTATKDNDPNVADTIQLLISDLTEIAFTPGDVAVNDTFAYSVTKIPDGYTVGIKGNPADCFTYVPATTNATGEASGTITATKPGTVTVFVGPYTGTKPAPKDLPYNASTVIAENSLSYTYKFNIVMDNSMYVGDIIQATTSDTRSVTWSSSNTNIATINSESGVITAVAPGTVEIKAVTNSSSQPIYESKASLKVKEKLSISTDQSTYYINLGGNVTIPVNVSPAGSAVSYTSSDTSGTYVKHSYTPATSSKPGYLYVESVSPSSNPITYTLKLTDYPEVSKSISVYINDMSNVKMTRVSSEDIAFTSISGQKSAQVKLDPETDYAKSHIIWTTSDSTVAQVSKDTSNSQYAAVVPKKNGTATITAKLVDNVNNPTKTYQSVTFNVTVSTATNYAYTYPSTNTKLQWYYDANSDLIVKTNIPASTVLQHGVQIYYNSSTAYTVPANQFTVTTESSTGYSVITINKTWLKNYIPQKKLQYQLNVFYGTNQCVTRALYIQSVKDSPITGDQNMSLYIALLTISGILCAVIPTSYYIRKKAAIKKQK